MEGGAGLCDDVIVDDDVCVLYSSEETEEY